MLGVLAKLIYAFLKERSWPPPGRIRPAWPPQTRGRSPHPGRHAEGYEAGRWGRAVLEDLVHQGVPIVTNLNGLYGYRGSARGESSGFSPCKTWRKM